MNIADFTPSELRSRFHHDGLRFRTGDFSIRVQTKLDTVIDGIALLYADFPIVEDGAFIDFHIVVDAPPNVRQWLRPQVRFMLDGRAPFLPLPRDQAFPLFEWGLNWCVSSHANSYLMIHAAVIEKNGRAAILPAPPGSGKSTLCAALVNRGWRLLSDELTLIRISDCAIVPLPRPVSLKNKSIDIIGEFESNAVISRRVFDTMKGTVAHLKAPTESVSRGTETCRAGWIIFPKYEADATTQLVPISKSRGFMRVADNAFNYSTLGEKGFNALAAVIDEVQCYDFTYSVLNEAIAAFDQLQPTGFNP